MFLDTDTFRSRSLVFNYHWSFKKLKTFKKLTSKLKESLNFCRMSTNSISAGSWARIWRMPLWGSVCAFEPRFRCAVRRRWCWASSSFCAIAADWIRATKRSISSKQRLSVFCNSSCTHMYYDKINRPAAPSVLFCPSTHSLDKRGGWVIHGSVPARLTAM